MKIITLATFFVLFTIVQCIPFPPDPDDSEPEIIADNLPSDSDSGSDNDVVILPDPGVVECLQEPPIHILASSPENSGPEDHDMEEPPIHLPSSPENSGPEDHGMEEPPIHLPSSPENSEPEDNDRDEQPPFLPNGVTGDESIQQTPELIRVWVRAPASLRNFDPQDDRHGVWHWRDRHLQASTSTGARGGLTLRTEWARLAMQQQPVACLARRNIEEPRRNIGN